MDAKWSDNFKRWIPHTMWVQMFVVLVLVVSIPLGVLGIMMMSTSQQAIKQSVLRDHKEIAARAANEIKDFLKHPQYLLQNTASFIETLNADVWREETVLVELGLNNDIFGRIAITDLSGQEIVTSEPGTSLGQVQYLPDIDVLRQRGYMMSDVTISDNHIPFMMISVPVRTFSKITHTLTAVIDLRGIWNIVDSIEVGQTGSSFIVSNNGLLIAHKDKKLVLQNTNLLDRPVVADVLQGNTNSREHINENKVSQLVSYAPIPGFGWGLVLAQDSAEAYAFLKEMKYKTWGMLAISLIALLVISPLIAKRVVSPVKILVHKTKDIAEGNYASIPVRRLDEIGELMTSFNQMAQQLETAKKEEHLTIVGKAARAIAHELKNSLVMVNTFIELFPQRQNDPEFIDKFIKVVPRELDHWKGMLKELSDFTKRQKFERYLIDVNQVVQDVKVLIEEKAQQESIFLDIQTQKPLPLIYGNADKLKQVLMNLIVNAIEAMSEGGVLSIHTAVMPNMRGLESKEIEIKVRDHGRGIAEEIQETMFEPFVTTKKNSLGLGLSVVRDIITKHGGMIVGQSKKNAGTTFLIRLPTVEVADKQFLSEEMEIYGRRAHSDH